jgi:hypothetical protein
MEDNLAGVFLAGTAACGTATIAIVSSGTPGNQRVPFAEEVEDSQSALVLTIDTNEKADT